ncbi:MAG: glycosyltransferase [Lachnospiraceae bacterium]|nr:glycosyltransferase [Lachnospiraceae bacterium]
MAKSEIRISQCMIVKNEEKNIERALSWGKRVMWEQIVVDTGSTDRTVELAERLGAQVCYFSWIDDFSAAKNFAIEQCRGDWIAILDADEYMTEEDAKKLPGLLEELEHRGLEGLSTGWQQLDDEGKIFSSGTQVRIFRNAPDIRYRRRIHEQLEAAAGRELKLGDVVSEISIFHTGYQRDQLQKKSGRNRVLIQAELNEKPDDYEMMGYMGDEYFGDGEKEEAARWYTKAIHHMPDKLPEYDQRSAVTFTNLLGILAEEEQPSPHKIQQVYEQAAAHLPQEADFDYTVGRFFATQGQAEQAAAYLETALHKLNTYGCNNRALHLAAELLQAYDLLVRCCYEAGQAEKCMNYGVVYLQYDRYGMGVLSRLLQTLLPGGRPHSDQEYQAVLEFFGRFYDFASLKDKVFLVKAAQLSECKEFAAYTASRIFTPQERTQLGL